MVVLVLKYYVRQTSQCYALFDKSGSESLGVSWLSHLWMQVWRKLPLFKDAFNFILRRGERLPGYFEGKKFVKIEEMVPEIIVPDLTGFTLKPYVSYRSMSVVQDKFTPKDLFAAVYAQKIQKDFEEGKLDEDGNSLEPSEEEKLTAEEAWIKAKKSGSDLFG